MRLHTIAALALFSLVAACGTDDAASSGNAFCDSYGQKLQDLHCSTQAYGAAAASACAIVLDGEKKCPAEYKAILTCQTTTSTCNSDGSVAFGSCMTESDAYSQCQLR